MFSCFPPDIALQMKEEMEQEFDLDAQVCPVCGACFNAEDSVHTNYCTECAMDMAISQL